MPDYAGILIDATLNDYKDSDLAIKYKVTKDNARKILERARRNPDAIAALMHARASNPSIEDKEIKAQNKIVAESRKIFNAHYKANREGSVFWVGDTHFPYARYDGVSLVFQIAANNKFNWITSFNDLNDMDKYGRWEKEPTPASYLWQYNIDNGIELIKDWHDGLSKNCPTAVKIGLSGNHDNWLLQYLRSEKHQNGFAEKNVTYFLQKMYEQGVLISTTESKREPVIKLGALKLVHGVSASSQNSTVAKNTIEKCREGRVFYNTASGHVHRDFTVEYNGVKHFNFGHICVNGMPYTKHDPHWVLGCGVLNYSDNEVEGHSIRFVEQGNKLTAKFNGVKYETELKKNTLWGRERWA